MRSLLVILLALEFLPFGGHFAVAQEACVAEVISYRSGNLRIAGVLMKPLGDGKFPTVIYNHGSRRVDREAQPTISPGSPCFAVVLERNWIYFIPERRGYGGSDGPAYSAAQGSLRGEPRAKAAIERLQSEAEDVLAGIEFLRAFSFVDPNRLVLVGHSVGGIVSFFVAAKLPTAFRAVVDQAGGFPDVSPFYEISLREMIRAGERIAAPILIQHGREDELVPLRLSIELRDELTRMGKSVTLRSYPGSHTVFLPPAPSGVWGRDLVDFLDRVLSP